MAQQVKPQRKKTYSMELAQLPAADTQARGRGPLLMDESPQAEPVPLIRGFQLTQIIESLDNAIPLPHDLRSFAIYFGLILTVAAGMMVHVLLSAQILQAKVELVNKQARHTVVERQNGELLWLIGRSTNLAFVQDRARAAGYRPIDERQFVEVDGDKVSIRRLDEEANVSSQFEPSRSAQQPSLASAVTQPDGRLDGVASGVVEPVPQPAEATGLLQQWRAVLDAGARSPGVSESEPGSVRQQLQAESEISQPAWLKDLVGTITDLFSGTRGQ